MLQDNVLAYMWFNLATGAQKWFENDPRNGVTAQIKQARLFRDKMLARRMTPAEIKEAQRRSRAWLDAHPQ